MYSKMAFPTHNRDLDYRAKNGIREIIFKLLKL